MFLCHATVRKNGKTHISFRLVRSVRRGRKVIQETIAHLGQPDAEGRAKGSALAKHFLGKRAKGPSLFEDMKPVATERAELGHIPVERLRAFGNVWIGLTVWQALGLDQLCEAALPSGRETIAWATMAAILVIARLCEPSSELHDARTAL